VASITTRVTPRQRSRSARPSSGRVIVAYACTSCSRRPGRSSSGTRTQHTSSALPISKAATRAMICSSSCVCVSISPASPWTEPKAAAARGSQRAWLEKLILVLVATLKGPRLAPSTWLINDLEDHSLNGVSGQQPHPIFRPERASPQGIPRLIRKRSRVRNGTRGDTEAARSHWSAPVRLTDLLTRPSETGETARDTYYAQRADGQVSAETGDGPGPRRRSSSCS